MGEVTNIVPLEAYRNRFDLEMEALQLDLNQLVRTHGGSATMRHLASLEVFPVNLLVGCLADLYDAGLEDFLVAYTPTAVETRGTDVIEIAPAKLAVQSRRVPKLALKVEIADCVADDCGDCSDQALAEFFRTEESDLSVFRAKALVPIKAYVANLLLQGGRLLGAGHRVMFFEVVHGDSTEIVSLELDHDYK